MIIGSHCGMNGEEMMLGSIKEALGYNANALMIYTGAPQSTMRKPISQLKIQEAQALMKANNLSLDHLIIHAPYIINPATNDLERRRFCISFLTEEIKRTAAMGAKTIVLHPGNALDQPIESAIKNIAFVINSVIANTSDLSTVIALETMAGKGSEVGRNFTELQKIISRVTEKRRIGVCLDTCHLHDSGYDIVNHYDEIKAEFNKTIGLSLIKVIHINDSKNECASHKDRHENIGKGKIGLCALKKVCHDADFALIPKILETPYVDKMPPYKEEIIALRG